MYGFLDTHAKSDIIPTPDGHLHISANIPASLGFPAMEWPIQSAAGLLTHAFLWAAF